MMYVCVLCNFAQPGKCSLNSHGSRFRGSVKLEPYLEIAKHRLSCLWGVVMFVYCVHIIICRCARCLVYTIDVCI